MSSGFDDLCLTAQQKRIIALLVAGVSDEDIACRISLSLEELNEEKKRIAKEFQKDPTSGELSPKEKKS